MQRGQLVARSRTCVARATSSGCGQQAPRLRLASTWSSSLPEASSGGGRLASGSGSGRMLFSSPRTGPPTTACSRHGSRRGFAAESSSSSAGLAQLKELRARTGAGVLDCKEALTAAAGSLPEAERWLLNKARSRFLKKADRPTTEGALALSTSRSASSSAALLLESSLSHRQLNSETDFVGRLESFQKLAHDAAVTALARSVEATGSSQDDGEFTLSSEWLASLPLGDSSRTVEEGIVGLFMQVGENMKARRGVLLRAVGPNGAVGTFIQGTGLPNTGTLAAMVSLQEKAVGEELIPLANLIAKQIAGANPKYLSLEDVPAEAKESAKEDVVLEQEVVFGDQTGRVRDLLEAEGRRLGGLITLTRFVRWKVGDGLEKPVTDFAAEVEKEVQRSSKH